MSLFQCKWSTCHELFDSQEDLIQHFKAEHDPWLPITSEYEKDENGKIVKMWTCQWRHGCQRKCNRLENFRTHVRSHTGEKPYTCDFDGCNKAFTNGSDRNKHRIRAHTVDRYYRCHAENCIKSYKDASSLRKHVLSAHGSEQYMNLLEINRQKRKTIPNFLDTILPNFSTSQLTIDQINTLQLITAQMVAQNQMGVKEEIFENMEEEKPRLPATALPKALVQFPLKEKYAIRKIRSLEESIENIRKYPEYYSSLIERMGFGNASLEMVVNCLQNVRKERKNSKTFSMGEDNFGHPDPSSSSNVHMSNRVLVKMTPSETGPCVYKTIRSESEMQMGKNESLYIATSLEEGLSGAFENIEYQRRSGIPPDFVDIPEEIRLYAASLNEEMSLEDDPLLNKASRTLRSVQVLNFLNGTTDEVCELYLLHLQNIMQIGLSLREPNPQHLEDHAAVCQGLHEFALMSNKLSSKFQLYSQLAFAHLMKSGFGSDKNTTTTQQAVVPKREPS